MSAQIVFVFVYLLNYLSLIVKLAKLAISVFSIHKQVGSLDPDKISS